MAVLDSATTQKANDGVVKFSSTQDTESIHDKQKYSFIVRSSRAARAQTNPARVTIAIGILQYNLAFYLTPFLFRDEFQQWAQANLELISPLSNTLWEIINNLKVAKKENGLPFTPLADYQTALGGKPLLADYTGPRTAIGLMQGDTRLIQQLLLHNPALVEFIIQHAAHPAVTNFFADNQHEKFDDLEQQNITHLELLFKGLKLSLLEYTSLSKWNETIDAMFQDVPEVASQFRDYFYRTLGATLLKGTHPRYWNDIIDSYFIDGSERSQFREQFAELKKQHDSLFINNINSLTKNVPCAEWDLVINEIYPDSTIRNAFKQEFIKYQIHHAPEIMTTQLKLPSATADAKFQELQEQKPATCEEYIEREYGVHVLQGLENKTTTDTKAQLLKHYQAEYTARYTKQALDAAVMVYKKEEYAKQFIHSLRKLIETTTWQSSFFGFDLELCGGVTVKVNGQDKKLPDNIAKIYEDCVNCKSNYYHCMQFLAKTGQEALHKVSFFRNPETEAIYQATKNAHQNMTKGKSAVMFTATPQPCRNEIPAIPRPGRSAAAAA